MAGIWGQCVSYQLQVVCALRPALLSSELQQITRLQGATILHQPYQTAAVVSHGDQGARDPPKGCPRHNSITLLAQSPPNLSNLMRQTLTESHPANHHPLTWLAAACHVGLPGIKGLAWNGLANPRQAAPWADLVATFCHVQAVREAKVQACQAAAGCGKLRDVRPAVCCTSCGRGLCICWQSDPSQYGQINKGKAVATTLRRRRNSHEHSTTPATALHSWVATAVLHHPDLPEPAHMASVGCAPFVGACFRVSSGYHSSQSSLSLSVKKSSLVSGCQSQPTELRIPAQP